MSNTMKRDALVKVARRNQAGALAEHLEARIGGGEWVSGFKLPAERELAVRFRTSRGAVRKVVDDFIARGVLRRAAGSGTYVATSSTATRAEPASPSSVTSVSPTELMEARLLFEPLLAPLIVRHATPQDFARLDECLKKGERAPSMREFEFWDGALHQAMSQATHNAFMIAVLDLMTLVREAGEWGRLKQHALTPTRRARYQTQHRAIVASLRERNETGASKLLKEHLLEVKANLFEK